jgi:PhzF family phenazine biosynthesis protein
MSFELLQVDAFTDRAFGGNPAAVCFCTEPREAGWMQRVARQMNLSETAFLERRDDGFGLRWFTPTVEVELCGHATLASAHALWETGRLDPRAAARFHTLSGELVAERRDGWIEMDFPAWLPDATPLAADDLAQALGVEPLTAVKCRSYCVVEVATEAIVRAATPAMHLLRNLPYGGVVLTARAGDPPFDIVSRFFAPAFGIDEDPVTGSAHCALGPFWCDRLGKSELLACQASPRGGTLRVRLAGDRVKLLGQAVTVWRGQLLAT